MSKKYNLLQALYLGFYSTDFYRDVARNWGGIGAKFLLLSCPIAALATAVIYINVFFQELRPLMDVGDALPTISVKDGKLVSPDKPLKFGSGNVTAITIDPSGALGSASEANSKFLITPTKFILNSSPQEVQIELSTFSRDWSLTGRQFVEQIKQIAILFATIVGLVFLLIEPFMRIIGAAIAAGIAKAFRSPRSFSEIMRLILAVSVPVSILVLPIFAIFMNFKNVSNLPNHITTLVNLIYIIVAFKSTRHPQENSRG